MDKPLESAGYEHKSWDGATTENLEEDTILIVGGGPVGLILATALAKHRVKSIILERNESTTRSVSFDMEILILTGPTDGRKWT